MNDIGNNLRRRFKLSKDFYKLIEKLKEEGYVIKIRKQRKSNHKEICIYKNERLLKDNLYEIKVIYEENEDITSEYKQSIIGMIY